MTALAVQRKDEIFDKIAEGQYLGDIAKSLGIASANISKHFAQDPQYKIARQAGAEQRLDLAYESLCKAEVEGMKDGKFGPEVDGNLVRARDARWKATAWFAEREFPERWGQKSEMNVQVTAPILTISVASSQHAAALPVESGHVIEHAQAQVPDK